MRTTTIPEYASFMPRPMRPKSRPIRVAALLFVAAATTLAQAPGSYVGWTAFGTATYNPFSPQPVDGVFGGAVAIVGDVDLDGTNDVVVQSGVGAFLHVLSGAAGTPIYAVVGTVGSDLGRAVANVGDVNGDGVSDFVATEPGYAAPGVGLTSVGRARLFSGASGAALWTVVGTTAFGRFGEAAAEIGDLDFDGVLDVVVGAPGGPVLGGPPAIGYALVLSGATGAIVRTYTSPPGTTIGRAFAKLGDFDGDGFPEALFTASYVASGGGPLVCGSAAAGVISGLTGQPLFAVTGPLCDMFGYSAAGLGDVNGDGIPDFAVGSPDHQVAPLGPGSATAFSGATGAALWSYFGTNANGQFGISLAGGFDFDGDGVPDLVAGAPESTVSGAAGRAVVLNGATGAVLATLTSHLPSTSRFGTSVAAGSDLNGDGVADVVAGAPMSSTPGFSLNGAVHVRSRFGFSVGATAFGAGCSGGLAKAPVLSTFGGVPSASVGSAAFGVAVSAAPASSAVVLLLGASATTWIGGSLPYNLATSGLPSCDLLTSPDLLLLSATSTSGVASFPFPIATVPALAGSAAYAQAYVASPATPLQGGTTAGLAVVLQ
jgi:hypothetical protein